MNWFIGLTLYVLIWWLVIFAVLPLWVKPAAEDDPGFAAGAPANPRLWLKAAITTGVSAVIWLAIYAVIASDLISFRSP
jgi:predicted secreted protein